MVILAKWGNSLAMRIPAKFAEQSGLREGTPVNISVREGCLVIERACPHYKLKELLAAYSPDDQAEEFWQGPPAGAAGMMVLNRDWQSLLIMVISLSERNLQERRPCPPVTSI